MKTIFKVIASIFALVTVILLALHLTLLYGLTKAMREVVLPQVKAQTGIDVSVGRLSINLPRGQLYLKHIEVRNPDGFLLENLASIDRVEVELEILSLLKQKRVQVKNIEVENALLNVIRNQAGEINLNQLQAGLPQPAQPPPGAPARVDSVNPPELIEPIPQPATQQLLPELLIERLRCEAKVRYVDLKLNKLDIALDLDVTGSGLSTLPGMDVPWGQLAVAGSLGDNRASFVTDLKLRLAPVTDPRTPSFDLSGRVLEINPQVMEEIYKELRIRSAPFGLEPGIHCRDGWFENSAMSLIIRDLELDERLARDLGGMSRIGTLKFSVPVEGALNDPKINIPAALMGAIGGNTRTLIDSFLKGAMAKELGREQPPETLSEAAVDVLADQVKAIGESATAKKVLKDLADGKPSDTNTPPPAKTDLLIDVLGEQVEEIGGNEELKNELKNLGRRLFGE